MPRIIAIVGGSGAGKTWLATRLLELLEPLAVHLRLDDFYQDRSHLTLRERRHLNFDHPESIEWGLFHGVVRQLASGRRASVPCYDFGVSNRLRKVRRVSPRPLILLDGLWLFHSPALVERCALRIFIDCPARTRLARRLARDLAERSRTRAAVEAQFWSHVEPMHRRWVVPQRSQADLVLRTPLSEPGIQALASRLRSLAERRSEMGDRRSLSKGTEYRL